MHSGSCGTIDAQLRADPRDLHASSCLVNAGAGPAGCRWFLRWVQQIPRLNDKHTQSRPARTGLAAGASRT